MAELPPLEHPVAAVDSFVVMVRRQTTNGEQGVAWAGQLQEAAPDREVTVVDTTGMDEKASGEAQLEALQKKHDDGLERPLLVSAGGDGALHYAGKRLVRPDTPAHLAATLLTPWDLGYANDGHASLHDPKTKGDPLAAFKHRDGHVIQSNPLEWTYVTPDGEVVVDWSLLYGTLGPTAVSAALLNDPKYRAKVAKLPGWLRKPRAIARSFPAMWWPPQMDVVMDGTRELHEIAELQVVNSPRMAINGDFSGSTHLADRAMHVSIERQRNIASVLWFAGRMAVGHPAGQRQTKPLTVVSHGGKPMTGQLDGEPFKAVALRVRPGERHLNLYATRKAA